MREEIMKHLESAYDWLRKIPVCDESVDWMAMARQEIRCAFKLLREDDADG